MAEVLIVGGGVVGMGLGMMLARDEHAVTILERDAQPAPKDSEGAWDSWDRKGINQFRLPHLFLPRYRQILESDLPEVAVAIEGDGALRFNPVSDAPETFTGGYRDGDERYQMLSGRRAVVERSVASVAEQTPGLSVRRGVAVAGLICGPEAISGIPHVTGVCTSNGEQLTADLVIDCSGRRSALPAWLEALGARRPEVEVDDSGFIHLGRHFRSRDSRLPVALGPGLQAYGSISVLTLPADNNIWSVTLVARSGDRALLGLKDRERWERAVRSLPTVAHWLGIDGKFHLNDDDPTRWLNRNQVGAAGSQSHLTPDNGQAGGTCQRQELRSLFDQGVQCVLVGEPRCRQQFPTASGIGAPDRGHGTSYQNPIRSTSTLLPRRLPVLLRWCVRIAHCPECMAAGFLSQLVMQAPCAYNAPRFRTHRAEQEAVVASFSRCDSALAQELKRPGHGEKGRVSSYSEVLSLIHE